MIEDAARSSPDQEEVMPSLGGRARLSRAVVRGSRRRRDSSCDARAGPFYSVCCTWRAVDPATPDGLPRMACSLAVRGGSPVPPISVRIVPSRSLLSLLASRVAWPASPSSLPHIPFFLLFLLFLLAPLSLFSLPCSPHTSPVPILYQPDPLFLNRSSDDSLRVRAALLAARRLASRLLALPAHGSTANSPSHREHPRPLEPPPAPHRKCSPSAGARRWAAHAVDRAVFGVQRAASRCSASSPPRNQPVS